MTSQEINVDAEYFRLKREGNEYFHRGDLVKAQECYQRSLECQPEPPREVLGVLHVNLATIYSKLQPPNWEAAVEHSNVALEINPQDDRALFGRYRAHDALRKYAEALDDITSCCCVKFHDAMYSRALDMAIIKVAEVDADVLVKNRRPSPRSRYNLSAYFKTFSSDPVVDWWNGKFPPNCEPLCVLSKMLADQSLEESGGDAGDTKVNLSGFVAAAWALRCQNFATIMDHCTEELRNEESIFKAEAHLLRGTFRYLWGYTEEEILEDLEPIAEGKIPASVEIRTSALMKLGELYTLLKDRPKTARAFCHAEGISPQNPDPTAGFCNAMMETDELFDAYAEIHKSCQIEPVFPPHLAIKCFLSFRLDAMKGLATAPIEGLNLFEKNIAQFPDCAELHVAFGHFFKDLRESTAAYMEFRKAAVLEPDNLGYSVNMIMMKFETTANMEGCVKELNEIIAKDPTCVSAYEALATLYVSVGRNFEIAFYAIENGLKFAKGRHDFLTFAILKKTAEVRQRVMAAYQAHQGAAAGQGRYDQFLVNSFDTATMD